MHSLIHFGFACRAEAERNGIADGIRETNPRRREEVNFMARTIAEAIVEQERPRVMREGLRQLLRRALEQKFGSLPSELLSRIGAFNDEERLDEAILNARLLVSLADLQL